MHKENLHPPILLVQDAIQKLEHQLSSGNIENPLLILASLQSANELLKTIYATAKRGEPCQQ